MFKKYGKYKPSGVEWIGDIPEHWDVWKISRAFRLIGSGTTPQSGTRKYYDNGTINWINTGDLNDGVLNKCEKKITEKAFVEHSTLKMYPKGTLLIAMYGATIGKTAIINFEACTNQACCALSGSKVLDNIFIHNWLIAKKPDIINLSYGGGQPNISQDIIRELRIPTPPKNEQKEILKYIEDKTAKIDTIITKYEKQISLLKEYRTSLISKAVTGQIDVRYWKPQKTTDTNISE